MARKQTKWGLELDYIKDLQKGDTAYCTCYGEEYIPVKVKRVRTVGCATIIYIEKTEGVYATRFVGYHTRRDAQGSSECVLTIGQCWAKELKNSLERADSLSQKTASSADALAAIRTIRRWLIMDDGELI